MDQISLPNKRPNGDPRCCSVPYCKTYGAPGISFHLFPKNPLMRSKWQIALGMHKPITGAMKVCSQHFQRSDFYETSTHSKRHKLLMSAVPTQNLSKCHTNEVNIGKQESLIEPESILDEQVCLQRFLKSEITIEEDVKREVLDEIKTYNCEICNDHFFTIDELDKHKNIHFASMMFECSYCNKRFSQEIELSKHIEEHMETKPASELHKCTICGKMFNSSSNLTKHMQVHDDEKLFECSFCNETFSNMNIMLLHTTRSHIEKRLHRCPICNKLFSKQQYLNNHLILHAKNIFQCSVCKKSFADSKQLDAHERNRTSNNCFET